MPRRPQPAMISGRAHCLRTVAVLMDSNSRRGGFMESSWRLSARETVHGEQGAHACTGELRVAQQSRGVGQLEELGEMQQTPRALLAAHHHEMILVTVQPPEKHHTRLVET